MFGLRLIGAVLILGIGANVLERLRFSALPQTRQTEDLLRERTPTPHGYSLFYGVAREKCGEQTRQGKSLLATRCAGRTRLTARRASGRMPRLPNGTSLLTSTSPASRIRISKSGSTPARSAALRTICTSPKVLVTVPNFSSRLAAGRTTSASAAVSVRKRSCKIRNVFLKPADSRRDTRQDSRQQPAARPVRSCRRLRSSAPRACWWKQEGPRTPQMCPAQRPARSREAGQARGSYRQRRARPGINHTGMCFTERVDMSWNQEAADQIDLTDIQDVDGLYSYSLVLPRKHAKAQDLVQDTYVHAMLAMGRLRTGSNMWSSNG